MGVGSIPAARAKGSHNCSSLAEQRFTPGTVVTAYLAIFLVQGDRCDW